MTNVFFLSVAMIVVFAILSMLFSCIWVYRDAKQRGLQAGLWVLVVALSGNFMGLIIYLLIGMNQKRIVCGNCGATGAAPCTFCPVCGSRVTAQNEVVRTSKTLLFFCIACIILSFASVGLLFSSAFYSDGFNINKQYSLYSAGMSGTAKRVSQSSSGNKWSLSFEDTSAGYTFKQTYRAKSKPVLLSVESSGTGTVQLIIKQNELSITNTIGSGSLDFDMSAFEQGTIYLEITNNDATDFSCDIELLTKDASD